MAAKVLHGGVFIGIIENREAIRRLAQGQARVIVKSAAVAALVNNAGAAGTIFTHVLPVTAVPNAATNLAQKAASEAAAVTVKDAISELLAKANAFATVLDLPTFTDNTGGAAADSTIGAISVSTTAATTGITATATNTYINAVNHALYEVAARVNEISHAVGIPRLKLDNPRGVKHTGSGQNVIPALSTDLGVAADPGVSKAAFDAAQVVFRQNISLLASRLIAVAAAQKPLLIAG